MASVKTLHTERVVPIWPFVACLGVIALVSGLNVAIGDPRTSGLDELSRRLDEESALANAAGTLAGESK